jgi:hypothetical protein
MKNQTLNPTPKEKELGFQIIETPSEYGSPIFGDPGPEIHIGRKISACDYVLKTGPNCYVLMRWGRCSQNDHFRWHPLSGESSDPSAIHEKVTGEKIIGEQLPECQFSSQSKSSKLRRN